MISSPGEGLVLRTTIACGVLETVAVVFRLVAQWKNNRKFYGDDWWIVASLIPSYAMLVDGMLMVTIGGGGRPVDTLSNSEVTIFLKTINVSLITYSLTNTMVKISILLLYRRVFDIRKCRIATTFLLLISAAWGIAALFALLFQCHPIAGMWIAADTFTDKCINLEAYYIAIAGSNMGLDIIILSMPIYMVWGYNGTGLRLPTTQKLMLTGVFLLGGLACIASLIRIITIHIIKGADLSYTVITPYIWSQIEPTTAIICASITTYRPLFRNFSFRPLSPFGWFSSSSSTANQSQPSSVAETAWPNPRTTRTTQAQTERRSVYDRFQDFIFNIPSSNASSRARTRPASEVMANCEEASDRPKLGIYDGMMKQKGTTSDKERDSGLGSELGSRAGSWLESGSSDDGVDRG